MENEQLIEIVKKLQEVEDIATIALVFAITLIIFILGWFAVKWVSNELDRRD